MDFSLCRTYGHAWVETDSIWKPVYGVPVTLICERCSMERREAIDRYNGRLLNRHYYYPPHYLMKAEDRLTRDDWRIVRIKARARKSRQSKKQTPQLKVVGK